MPHATVSGVRLYYEERGTGTPILGIHGAGSSSVFWENAAERLAEHGRVITYDRRGSNRSERPEPYETTSVQEHADDALALLRELGAEPAVLIGRSYGARSRSTSPSVIPAPSTASRCSRRARSVSTQATTRGSRDCSLPPRALDRSASARR